MLRSSSFSVLKARMDKIEIKVFFLNLRDSIHFGDLLGKQRIWLDICMIQIQNIPTLIPKQLILKMPTMILETKNLSLDSLLPS